MVNSSGAMPGAQHTFSFQGQSWEFFKIFITNVLFIIVTAGIYMPWARVRSRRYICQNMMLNHAQFDCHLRGSDILLSIILLTLLILAGAALVLHLSMQFIVFMMIIVTLTLPILFMNGLRYQAIYTSFDNVRFGFQCSAGRALWQLLLLPVLLMIVVNVLITLISYFTPMPLTPVGIIGYAVFMLIMFLLLGATGWAIFYASWLKTLVNNSRLGHHAFSISFSVSRCILIFSQTASICIIFIATFTAYCIYLFLDVVKVSPEGVIQTSSLLDLITLYWLPLALSTVCALLGITLAYTFLLCRLRNLMFNGLALGEHLTFRSSLTFGKLVGPVLLLFAALLFTVGLAWPWAKVRLLRRLASNTTVIGDLALLTESSDDGTTAQKPVNVLSRGLFTFVPFI